MTQSNDQHDLPPQPSDDSPHKPADDKEEVYFYGTPLVRWQLISGWPWVLFGLILVAAPILLKIFTTAQVPWWIYPIALAIGLLLMLIPYFKSKTLRYKITNYRIDREAGLIGKEFDTMELWHVEDIRLDQSILDRMLGVGTITIYSHDRSEEQKVFGKGEFAMSGLPNPRELFDSLKQRIIAVKRQRGVVKMDVPTIEEQPHHQ